MDERYVCCTCIKEFRNNRPVCTRCGSPVVRSVRDKLFSENKEKISVRANKKLWFEFTHTLKKQKRTVWEVLEGFITFYLEKSRNGTEDEVKEWLKQ